MAERADRQTADVLRKEQAEARASRDLNMAETTAKVGGRTLQGGGTLAQYSGQAAKPVARGVTRGGESMMEAGGELSSTVVGAPLGILLTGAGAGVTGLGMIGQGLAEGAEEGGRASRRLGSRAVNYADQAKKNRRGLFGGLRSQTKDDTGSLLGSLRHRARQNMPAPLAQAEASAMHAVSAPVRTATGEALRQAWINLIPSWGLTLIYINIHAFGRLMAGSDFFCKLGHEWTGGVSGMVLAGGGSSSGNQILKQAADKIGLLELGLLFLADFIVAVAVAVVLILIIFIVSAIVDPLSTIGQVFSNLF